MNYNSISQRSERSSYCNETKKPNIFNVIKINPPTTKKKLKLSCSKAKNRNTAPRRFVVTN